jgi:hypothetical protein
VQVVGSGYGAGTIFGGTVNLASLSRIYCTSPNAMAIQLSADVPLVIGTNNVERARLNATSLTLASNDLVCGTATKGLVLKDTQATPHYWRVTISNVGAIVTSDIGTSAP